MQSRHLRIRIDMSRICEHEFTEEDPFNRGYSMTEVDLYSRLNMSIRRNLKNMQFEIFRIKDKSVVFEGTLKEIVNKINQLEKSKSMKIECSTMCPKKRSQKRLKDFNG